MCSFHLKSGVVMVVFVW